MTQHKTARGALMAKLDWRKVAAGEYVIEGYGVIMRAEASGSRPGRWEISDVDTVIAEVTSLTAALQFIDEKVADIAAKWAAVLPTEIVAPEVETETEVIDETPAPVAPEVTPEPVAPEVQEVVTPTPVSTPVKKTRTPKTRRAELLEKLGARTLNTAEYAVAGHHVEYVAPGVMPRNAGGRWRTTLLSDEGVVVSWNLSLTAALEVVESRVAEGLTDGTAPTGQTPDTSSNVRQYVAVYPSTRNDVDLCELHAPGCADLTRTEKKTDPQATVSLDITDEDAAMLVLDPDELGYDMYAVKVMPCAQHAPLAENAHA